MFASLGLRPGKPLVVIASITEIAASLSLLFGLLTVLGSTAAFAAMIVAGYTVQSSALNFWN